MDPFGRWWATFRSWPWWAQALAWLTLCPLPLALLTATKPSHERPPWIALTGIAVVVWLAILISSNHSDGKQAVTAGVLDETSTTDRPVTTTERHAPTTTRPVTTTTLAKASLAVTTLPPTTTTQPPTTVTIPPTITTLSATTTQPPTTAASRQPSGCAAGYDPCIGPGDDVDCAGGSGDGPRYVDGPVYVTGSDPYDLDRDSDGVGCES
ncbi:MAG: hypothetical protein LC808_09405 [Actinobacteria bacterium]|nr:hypothetical protein [Actinomycetota bacterium]